MSSLNIFLCSSLLLTMSIGTISCISDALNSGCSKINVCSDSKRFKLYAPCPDDNKSMTTWDEVLNETITKLNETHHGLFWDMENCNMKIEFNNGSRSQYIVLPQTTNYHLKYLTKLLSYEFSQRRNCRAKSTISIPIKILPWNFSPVPAFVISVNSTTQTTKKKNNTPSGSPTAYITSINNVTNLDKIMADAKYGHSN